MDVVAAALLEALFLVLADAPFLPPAALFFADAVFLRAAVGMHAATNSPIATLARNPLTTEFYDLSTRSATSLAISSAARPALIDAPSQ